MKISTAELTGAALDYAVAKCEGFGWAKNMSRRSGDSAAMYHNSNHKPNWPIGARCFVRPSAVKDLHPTEKNWDGWCIADMTEPVAPAAFYDVPTYSRRWSEGGPIIKREKIAVVYRAGGYWLAYSFDGAEVESTDDDPLVAAMRCYVASKLGGVVDIPDELCN